MAELVVGPLISLVMEKASSYLLDQYKVMEGMEEQREILERKLPAIQGVIEDAEKGASRPRVDAWLKALKKVSYEAIDVFDEFKYEALRRDAKKKGHYKKLGMDVVSLFPAHSPIVFRHRMGKKLRRIVQTIETLILEMNEFGFMNQQQPAPSNQWRQTFPMIDESEKDIIARSRDVEKKNILKILLDGAADRDPIVLPIVGMGGLGKTTFAQLIYNDPEIEKHFELRRWCCVSEDFDVVKIAGDICQTNERGSQKSLQDLQREVSGKRYLIVLDDVWNRVAAKWGVLKACFQCGGKGSAILTTTRNQEVAEIMASCMVEAYNLEKLGNEFLKEIVQNRALKFGKTNFDELDGMLFEIAKKCDGSPLAAKAFGSLLSNKTSKQQWKDTLAQSNICNERTGILPILKLSYDDLPPHMKQCFAFCAMFPKDYEIDIEMLVQLWIAHDFIPPQEESNLEIIGEGIFKELAWRSFFQDVKQVQHINFRGTRIQLRRYRTICKIHDLMHDIAQLAMGKECVAIVNGSDHKKLSLFTRHVFTSFSSTGTLLYDFLSKKSSTLRTLLYLNSRYTRDMREDFSKYFSSLRALLLSQWWGQVPIKTMYLKHLRYLNLSDNICLKELPEGIGMLYNLQILDLSGCEDLRRLPEDMKYLTSLRHLYTSGCKLLECMPPDLGQLTYLHTLTYFVVGATSSCSSISELHNLNLSGELNINGLENVTEEHAKAARLEIKEKVTHLSLQWNSDVLQEPVLNYHRKVLDCLKPHGGLEMIRISNYKSTSFPTWVTDPSMLKHLTELQLVGCTQCEEFPAFWHFTALKFLHLENLKNLQVLCGGDMDSMPFSVLRELKLLFLDKLERWLATDGGEKEQSLPVLERMEIIQCPNLTTLPEAPKLKFLKLDEDKAGLSLSLFKSRYMFSLSQLTLSIRSEEATLQLDQSHKASVSEMVLKGCNFFFASSPATVGIWSCFARLVDLEIEKCNSLIYWPDVEFLGLVSLKNLSISCCPKLIGSTQLRGVPSEGTDLFLPHLETLHIYDCESLTELFIFPSSLKDVSIYFCPAIEFIWGKTEAGSEDIHVEVEQADDPASTVVKKLSPSARNHPPPCLKRLEIYACDNLVMLPDIPSSLEVLDICGTDNLRSVTGQLDALKRMVFANCSMLESSGCLVHLPSLESLHLYNCKRLTCLPGGPGNYYSTLRELKIEYCPAFSMKPLYKCLHRYSNLEVKDLTRAHSGYRLEGPKLRNPKSWKYAFCGRPSY